MSIQLLKILICETNKATHLSSHCNISLNQNYIINWRSRRKIGVKSTVSIDTVILLYLSKPSNHIWNSHSLSRINLLPDCEMRISPVKFNTQHAMSQYVSSKTAGWLISMYETLGLIHRSHHMALTCLVMTGKLINVT